MSEYFYGKIGKNVMIKTVETFDPLSFTQTLGTRAFYASTTF